MADLTLFRGEEPHMSDDKRGHFVEVNDETLDAMVARMMEFQKSGLKAAVSRYPVDTQRFSAVFDEAIQESDRVSAILIMAFVDDILGEFYRWRLNPKVPGGVTALLEGYGPLASASGRLQVAYSLKWLSDETFASANLMRKIRNHFAHDTRTSRFGESPVRDLVGTMAAQENRIFKSGKFPCTRDLTLREQYLMRALLTTCELWMELAVRPQAVEFWMPGATPHVWELAEMPENLGALIKTAIRKVLELAPLAPKASKSSAT